MAARLYDSSENAPEARSNSAPSLQKLDLHDSDYQRQLLSQQQTVSVSSIGLVKDKILPAADVVLTAINQTSTDTKLLSKVDTVYRSVASHEAFNEKGERVQLANISASEREAISRLSPLKKQLFEATLGELAALQAAERVNSIETCFLKV